MNSKRLSRRAASCLLDSDRMPRCAIAVICVLALATAGCAKRGRHIAQIVGERVTVAKAKPSPQPVDTRRVAARKPRPQRRAVEQTRRPHDTQPAERAEGTTGFAEGPPPDVSSQPTSPDQATADSPPGIARSEPAPELTLKERFSLATSRAALIVLALATAAAVMVTAIIHLRRRTHA